MTVAPPSWSAGCVGAGGLATCPAMTIPNARAEFPALSATDRERILAGFNDNNQAYFGGHLGYR